MNDRDYMLRAIELAKKGAGYTAPNPMVGAVIVKNGKIIGEGYHERCGELHAERNAIASLREPAEGAAIYVTLEPCCHYGKTPPCTEAIIENKIAKVIIGSRDPNPLVSGKGAKILEDHGIEVIRDFMKEECDEINPAFFHYITTKKPYVILKYAMTLDGKIACYTGDSKWITGEEARKHVHKLRGEYSAILAGIGTVLADDPMLNARTEGAHQPLRVIVDSKLRIPLDSQIVKTAKEYRTIAACGFDGFKSPLPEGEKFQYKSSEMKDEGRNPHNEISAGNNEDNFEKNIEHKEVYRELSEKKDNLEKLGVEVISFPGKGGRVDLKALINYLGEQQISSVLVEGGGNIHESFLREGLADHVCAYIAPKIFGGKDAKTPVEGEGVSAPCKGAELKNIKITRLGEDMLVEGDIVHGFRR